MNTLPRDRSPKHWLIRVKDGKNFNNSKFPFWGVKRGRSGCYLSIVKKFKIGDILWFMTSKSYGGKLIGMSEYTKYYDKEDEPLININTFTNDEQNWEGDVEWDIQIHYTNLYITEKQNITACGGRGIQCAGIILDYETFKEKIDGNLYDHYRNFKFYAEESRRFKC